MKIQNNKRPVGLDAQVLVMLIPVMYSYLYFAIKVVSKCDTKISNLWSMEIKYIASPDNKYN